MSATIAAAVIVLGSWNKPTPDIAVSGNAKFYDPGLMAIVARNNKYSLAGYVDGVALMRKADKGRAVWILHDKGLFGPFLAVDCAQREHYLGRVDKDDVVEVSYKIAMQLGMRGPEPVTVLFEPPPGEPH